MGCGELQREKRGEEIAILAAPQVHYGRETSFAPFLALLGIILILCAGAIFIGAGRLMRLQRSIEGYAVRMPVDIALTKALRVLYERNLMHSDNYRLTASRVNDRWVFWFVFLPETPGLDVTVTIDNDGSAEVLPGI